MKKTLVQTADRRRSSARRMSSRVLISNKAYRVIAPYAVFGVKEEVKENKTFQYYVQRKPELLLKDMSNYLSDMVDLRAIIQECSWMLKLITKAEGVNFYLVDKTGTEIYLAGNVDVNERYRLNWSIRSGTTIAAYVAHTMDSVMVDQISKDSRFPDGVAYNPLASSVLCVPIIKTHEDCYGIIELYKNIGQQPFSTMDQEFVSMVTSWMSAAIYENNHRVAVQKEKELNDYLLNITSCYFSDPDLLKSMISEMVNFSRTSLGANRARFFIFEEKTYDGFIMANLYDEREEFDVWYLRNRKVILNEDRGIIEYVARTGETLNVRDATLDPRFQRDLKPGLISRSVLCVPIVVGDQILGVVEAENKKDGGYFNCLDEIVFKTFSVYCSFALHYSTQHRQMEKNQIISLSFSRMLNYHLKPCTHDYDQFLDNPFPEVPLDFNHFNWYIPKDLKHDMPRYILYMFLKIIGSCFLVFENTIKFILEVQKAYKNHPFHNFEHAFNFTHSVYLMLLRNPKKFTVIEQKGLLIGGFCHALDHSGFSKHFLRKINDDRAQLYTEFPEQNHAFFITSQLLNTCKIFRYLTPKEYESILNEIKEAILATDWYRFLRIKRVIYKELKQKTFSWKQPAHRQLAKSVLMSAAESSFCWKRFGVVKDILQRYFQELYAEAELEKAMGNTPIKHMDKVIDMIIMEQLNLFSILWLSSTQLMKFLLPNTSECYELVFKLLRNLSSGTRQKMWIISGTSRPVESIL